MDHQRGGEMPGRSDTSSAQGKELVITRVFDAPRDLVFKAFTESDSMAQWWGPKGWTIQVSRFEFRPGGIFLYSLKEPSGQVMWARFVYREISPPERIVFVNSFSDEAGGVTRAPFSATWPLEMLTTMTFSEQGGKTTITLRVGAIPAADDERRTFEDGFDSMRQGFGGTFDQLAEYLANEQAS
jgi:uncharacterized protein YndB with AHSA1/START domain